MNTVITNCIVFITRVFYSTIKILVLGIQIIGFKITCKFFHKHTCVHVHMHELVRTKGR